MFTKNKNNTGQDPAVLWYTNDFLEGTADMSPEEIGVYTVLLCYQHRRGYLPSNTRRLARLVRLPEEEFSILWEEVQKKFVRYTTLLPIGTDTGGDGGSEYLKEAIANKRMYLETKKRSQYLEKKAVFAIVGNWFRYHPTAKMLKKAQKEWLKKEINYSYIFENLLDKNDIEKYINTLADRFAVRSDQGTLSLIENEDVDVNENKDEDVNSIENKTPVIFGEVVFSNFVKRLCDFFSQQGSHRDLKVIAFLKQLESQGSLEEFWRQTEAYMGYKSLSREKIHSWAGYKTAWNSVDWQHKLKTFQHPSHGHKRFAKNH